MWRHRTSCSYCAWESSWQQDLSLSEGEAMAHLQQAHGTAAPAAPQDYATRSQRQCDYCLEPYLDDCTKCRRDFCHLHAGDIDGLCGGCI